MDFEKFVEMVARMEETSDSDDAIATVNRLIGEARKIIHDRPSYWTDDPYVKLF